MKALIIIDVQNGLTKKKALYNEDLFVDTINSAINNYRKHEFEIVFVQHKNNQLQPGTFEWEIDQRLDQQKYDIIIHKKHGNAFQKTDLTTILKNKGIKHILIAGLVSHGCVRATCLGGVANGFKTSILKTGHTNWNKEANIKIAQTGNELVECGVTVKEIN